MYEIEISRKEVSLKNEIRAMTDRRNGNQGIQHVLCIYVANFLYRI